MSRRRFILLSIAAVAGHRRELPRMDGLSTWPLCLCRRQSGGLGLLCTDHRRRVLLPIWHPPMRARAANTSRAWRIVRLVIPKRAGSPLRAGAPSCCLLEPSIRRTSRRTRKPGLVSGPMRSFSRRCTKGISADGKRLYAAFPFASYTMLTDADVIAIKAYLFSRAAGKTAQQAKYLHFSLQSTLADGLLVCLFQSRRTLSPHPRAKPEWNRGAYLAEAAGHCGECHTPRNLLQAMNQREKFAGGAAEGWSAYNITSDPISGVGSWSAEELAAYLARGHAHGRGTASGPMGEAVDLSLSNALGLGHWGDRHLCAVRQTYSQRRTARARRSRRGLAESRFRPERRRKADLRRKLRELSRLERGGRHHWRSTAHRRSGHQRRFGGRMWFK